MKTTLITLLAVLLCCAGYAREQQTTEKKLTRKEKKALREAEEQALFEQSLQAICDSAFVLEADYAIINNRANIQVTSHTNFVMVDKDQASVQIAFNIPSAGLNGLGGITVEGSVSGYKIKTDKKGSVTLTMNVMGRGIHASVLIMMYHGSNNATVEVAPNFSSHRLRLSGTLIPFEQSKVFKGTIF